MSTKQQQYVIPNVSRNELTNTIATALSRHGSRTIGTIDLQVTLTGPDTYTITVVNEIPLRRRLAATPGIIDADRVQADLVVV